MIKLPEMQESFPVQLHDGARSTTTEVWSTLVAAAEGDLDRISRAVNECAALATCQYNYTPPIHFAVREGHYEVVRFLVEHEALNPAYQTYPFGDPLPTMARDRNFSSIAEFLEESLSIDSLCHRKGECGEIDFGWNDTQKRFEKAVHGNDLRVVRKMLDDQPELANQANASWGEGILMMPSGRRKQKMLELLMSHGAKVPETSKWGRFYYFKHFDIAEFLLENGMSPQHMSWHSVTLLHDMAQEGDLAKAGLLLDHGADINAIDEEYQSSPLGLAARWGRHEMVEFLLERGADPNRSGADWSTPLTWSRTRAFPGIEQTLRKAGAR